VQYPVPQFTDVEDKLIGPLGLKQFFIVFIAGALIFGGYSATKSVAALVALFILFGAPALMLAFAKINGRPAYKQIPFLIRFVTEPKKMVFHKEVNAFKTNLKMKDMEIGKKEVELKATAGDTKTRLREVQTILQKQQEEEAMLIDKIDHK